MINREYTTVTVSTFSEELDEYGQKHKEGSTQRTVEMVLKPYNHVNVTDVRFLDVTLIGLTEDKEILLGDEINVVSDKYLVTYVQPSRRLTQVFLKKI